MKIYLILSLTLLSLMADVKYTVDDYSCENNQIRVKYQENWFDISLFNIKVEEESNICSYIDGEVAIEIESAIQMKEPYSLYVFVNDVLLQETLVNEGIGEMLVNSPAYKYFVEEEVEMVSASNEEKIYKKQSYSRFIAISIVSVWGIICLVLFRKSSLIQKDIIHDKNDV